MYSTDLNLTVHINICLETLNKQTNKNIRKSPFTLSGLWGNSRPKWSVWLFSSWIPETTPHHSVLAACPNQPFCCLAVAYKLLLVFMSTDLEGVCLVPSCPPPFACVYPAWQHCLQSAQEDIVSPGRHSQPNCMELFRCFQGEGLKNE